MKKVHHGGHKKTRTIHLIRINRIISEAHPPLSFFHVLPILPKLPPEHSDGDGHQQDNASGYEVRDGQEVGRTSEPGQRGQHHFLSALEGLYREVWKGRGQG